MKKNKMTLSGFILGAKKYGFPIGHCVIHAKLKYISLISSVQ